jgi:hypothetical protein
MKNFTITNKTANKIVLKDFTAPDKEYAAGQYISALFLNGLIAHCDKDIKWIDDSTFLVLPKNWTMTIN